MSPPGRFGDVPPGGTSAGVLNRGPPRQGSQLTNSVITNQEPRTTKLTRHSLGHVSTPSRGWALPSADAMRRCSRRAPGLLGQEALGGFLTALLFFGVAMAAEPAQTNTKSTAVVPDSGERPPCICTALATA